VDLSDPGTAAALCAEALGRAGIPHALYGGLLLAAYGEPRETHDAGFAVVDADAGAVGKALAAAGLEARLTFADVRFGGHSLDRFALLGSPSLSGMNVLDIVRPRSPRYRSTAIERALAGPLFEVVMRALAPEDFVVFKLLSTRDKDLRDAGTVFRAIGGRLDAALIRREVDALAGEIPDVDIRGRLGALVRLVQDPAEWGPGGEMEGEVHEMTPAQWKRLAPSPRPRVRRRK